MDSNSEAQRVLDEVKPGGEATYANAMAYASAHAVLALADNLQDLVAEVRTSNHIGVQLIEAINRRSLYGRDNSHELRNRVTTALNLNPKEGDTTP